MRIFGLKFFFTLFFPRQAAQCLPMALRSMSFEMIEETSTQTSNTVQHESHHLNGKPDDCCIPENGDVTRGTIFNTADKQCVNGTLV